MSCNCNKTNLQGTQYCQECMPDEVTWLVPTNGEPDPFFMDRHHAYIAPNNEVYVLSHDRTRALGLEVKSTVNVSLSEVDPGRILYVTKGVNLFNKDTAVLGKYVTYKDGTLVDTTHPYYASDFIPIKPNTLYTKNDDGQQVAFYDASKQFVSGQASGLQFTTPNNASFVRVAVLDKYINSFMLVEGKVIGAYEPYTLTVDRDIIAKLLPLGEDHTESVYTDLSKNLFNKAKSIPGGYWHFGDGRYRTQSLYSSSEPIVVTPGEWYTKNDPQQVAFYDENHVYVSGMSTATTFQAPSNATYMRVTILTKDIDKLQVEKGKVQTTYTPYGALYLQRENVERLINNQVVPKFLLPSKIRVHNNKQFDIYFDGALKHFQEYQKGNYYITAQDTTSATPNVIKGKLLKDKWFFTPNSLGKFKITFRIVDTYTDVVVDSKEVEFEVVSKPNTTFNIVTIGDSFTDQYGVTKRLAELMEADGVTSNFIGLHETGKDGVKDDAWSGWSWEHFSRGASGYKRTDRPDSGATSTVNQFYNPATKKFDFAYYMSTYQSGKTVDTVIINLGLNDVQKKTVTEVKAKLAQARSDVQAILNSIKGFNSNIKIFVGLVPKQCSDNAFLGSYSTTYNSAERVNHNIELYNELLLEMSSLGNVFLVPTNANFDKENSYLTSSVVTNQITGEEQVLSSDLHPNTTGTEYIARTVYQALYK